MNKKLLAVAVLLAAFSLLFATLAVKAIGEVNAMPMQPERVTLATLSSSSSPWLEVVDAVALCNVKVHKNGRDYVPIVDATAVVAFAVVELDVRTLCSTLPRPLLAERRAFDAVSIELGEQLARGAGRMLFDTHVVLKPNDDVLGSARGQVAATLAMMLAFLGGALFVARHLVKQRSPARGITGTDSSAAVPSAGEIHLGVRGVVAAASDPILPPGPLKLTERAERSGKLTRAIAAPLLAVASAALAASSLWVAHDIIEDQLVWRDGVHVDAEVKGEYTRYQGIYVDTQLSVAWLPPGAPDGAGLMHASKSFGAWFVDPDNAGEVRVLANDPSSMTVQAAVDAWPWRAPTVVFLLGCALLMGFGARAVWKTALRLGVIAANPEVMEVALVHVLENRVNGARTGYSCTGLARDGSTVSFALNAKQTPSSLVLVDDGKDGARVLVVRARGAAWVTPVFTDLAPFELSRDERARAQAVLTARGSPTVLAG